MRPIHTHSKDTIDFNTQFDIEPGGGGGVSEGGLSVAL